jgi:hypothetical protein
VGGKLLGLPRVAEAQLGQIEQTSRADSREQGRPQRFDQSLLSTNR